MIFSDSVIDESNETFRIRHGYLRGLREGIEEGRMEVALKMLEAGMDDEIIHAVAGITSETLVSLQRAIAPQF